MNVLNMKWIWLFLALNGLLSCNEQKQHAPSIQDKNLAPSINIPTKSDTSKVYHPEEIQMKSTPAKQKEINSEKQSPAPANLSDKKNSFNYSFNLPDKTFALAQPLREISGLSYTEKDQILAVNDELGIIYTLSPTSGDILKKEKFRSKGDYEGIEIIEDIIYVLKSNGTLYSYVQNGSQNYPSVNTPLKDVNDVEGLGYDPQKNELLLACKGKCLSPTDQSKGYKSIYAFDLEAQILKESPRFSIQTTSLINHLPKGYLDAMSSQKEINKIKNRTRNFAPSGIAVHPITNDIYVLSSSGKSIAQCNSKGEVRILYLLDHKAYIQPEGICFAPDGTLFISNEGKRGSANLMVFEPK